MFSLWHIQKRRCIQTVLPGAAPVTRESLVDDSKAGQLAKFPSETKSRPSIPWTTAEHLLDWQHVICCHSVFSSHSISTSYWSQTHMSLTKSYVMMDWGQKSTVVQRWALKNTSFHQGYLQTASVHHSLSELGFASIISLKCFIVLFIAL